MTAAVPMMMTVLFYAMQCTEQVDAKTKGSVRTECGQLVHCVEPIPDNDWQGGHFILTSLLALVILHQNKKYDQHW